MCTPCFGVSIGSTCLYMLKLFLPGFEKFWVLQRHMSPGTLNGALVSPTLVAGVSLLSILQAGDWT